MTAEPLDVLLEKLNTGDADAAAEVFRNYEPYLRMVVRRRLSPDLRAKFDSLDIVQSVWVHILKGFRESGKRFADVGHLRAFLVQLTRHRLVDRFRRHRLAVESEQPLEADGVEDALVGRDPQPADVLQAEELWEQLLELCPPAHQEILRLKRSGAATSEIAVRTGLNEGSIRRILHVLSRRLARQSGEEAP